MLLVHFFVFTIPVILVLGFLASSKIDSQNASTPPADGGSLITIWFFPSSRLNTLGFDLNNLLYLNYLLLFSDLPIHCAVACIFWFSFSCFTLYIC